jgi:7,8-dihydropterin-6-yl-methyl-4-(beta-D-ribofuranosyl)aminobenzene 5'-phosphate synthase
VNVVKDAVEMFSRPIYMVVLSSYTSDCRVVNFTSRLVKIVGGLHLAGPELADRIKPTVHFLSEALIPAPTYVLPMHCSGFATKVALEAALGEGCVPAGAGHKVIINGVPEDDASLRPPSIRSH